MPHNDFKQKILKGCSWAFVGKVVTALTGLAVNALLTRLLSPEDMGAYFLLLSLTSFFATVAQLGLTQTIVKLVAEAMATDQPNKARLAIRLSMRLLGIGIAIVMYLLAYGVGTWISKNILHSEIIAPLMGLSAIWVCILATQSFMAEVYRGFHDIRLATIFGGLITSFLAMLMFLTIWLSTKHSNLEEVILITIVAGISSVIISSLVLSHKITHLMEPKGNEIQIPEITEIASPLWTTNIMLFVLMQVDIWIMGVFCQPDEVALYGSASRLIMLIAMPFVIVNAVTPPIISEMFAQGKVQDLEERLKLIATISSIPSIIVFIFLCFYADVILILIFGEFYRSASAILMILAFGQLLNVLAGSCGEVLIFTGSQKVMMYITISCGVISTGLSWFMVQSYQGIGVSVAVTIGVVLQNILALLATKFKIGIWTHAGIPGKKIIQKFK